jgi:hypothetical protein
LHKLAALRLLSEGMSVSKSRAQYAFGEMDDTGSSNLKSFAAQNHCKIDQMPEGRVYFTRQG